MTAKTLIYALFAGILVACTEPISIESVDYERVLVVEGAISDLEKEHIVRLSYTFPIDSILLEPAELATVYVVEDGSNRIDFEEKSPGIYAAVFQGKKNSIYQLFITLSDGKEYESSADELIPAPGIANITNTYLKKVSNELENGDPGAQFLLEGNASKEAVYFRFEFEETAEIRVPYPSQLIYDHASGSVINRPDRVSPCWESLSSNNILIGTSVDNQEKKLVEYPIHFVSAVTSDLLRNRYSLLARQYAISESAYSFYRKIKEINEFTGSLFDQQQGTVTGNVIAVEDPLEPVLGYFEVAGVAEKRAFFNNEDLDPEIPFPNYRYMCNVFEVRSLDSVRILSANHRIYTSQRDNEGAVFYLITNVNCGDCTAFASREEPDFWIK